MSEYQTQSVSHRLARRALGKLFVEEDAQAALGEVSARAVQAHLAECAECRRVYDTLAVSDRRLSVEPAADEELIEREPAGFESAFGEAAFMGALDELLEEEAAEPADEQAEVVELAEESPPGAPRPFSRFLAAAAVLLVAGAGWYGFQLLQADGPQSPGQVDEFQARTAASPHEAGPFEAPELEVFCATRSSDGVDFTGSSDAPFGLLSCPLDAEIKLAYTNPSAELSHAAFFGVDERGTIYWYGPTPADMDAVAVSTSQQLEPFGETVRLEVNHQPGRVRLVGLFATEPVDFVTVQRVVDRLELEAVHAGQMPQHLEVPGTLVSTSFEVIDGGSQ